MKFYTCTDLFPKLPHKKHSPARPANSKPTNWFLKSPHSFFSIAFLSGLQLESCSSFLDATVYRKPRALPVLSTEMLPTGLGTPWGCPVSFCGIRNALYTAKVQGSRRGTFLSAPECSWPAPTPWPHEKAPVGGGASQQKTLPGSSWCLLWDRWGVLEGVWVGWWYQKAPGGGGKPCPGQVDTCVQLGLVAVWHRW